MSIERVSPEKITVSVPEPAVKITQTGTGYSFLVEDSSSPDSTPFVIDSEGKVGINTIPTQDLDINGIVAATNIVPGYETTTTSGSTKTLTVESAQQQFFLGSLAHTVQLPAVTTLTLGHYYVIHNNSGNSLTINSSGGNLVLTMPQGTTAQFTCIATTGSGSSSWDADAAKLSGYETTVTASGTTTLDVASAERQFFTGTQTQTVELPDVSTLTLGQYYTIHNNSTGALTINSSGGDLVTTLPGRQTATLTAIATSGTDDSVWDVDTAKVTAYETTATSGGATTLNVSSPNEQFFTGTSTHTVVLPDAGTLTVGDYWSVHNDSTQSLTIQTSGGNTLTTLTAGTTITVTCVLASGTGTSSWSFDYSGFNTTTGTGSLVFSASPTLTGTPAAPTASTGTNTTQIATTAFVRNELSDLVSSAPATLDTLNELAAALGDDPNFATTVTNSIAEKVAKDGDTMTGRLNINKDSFDPALGWESGQTETPAGLNFQSNSTIVGNLVGQTYKMDSATWNDDRVTGFFGMEQTSDVALGSFTFWLADSTFARSADEKMRLNNDGNLIVTGPVSTDEVRNRTGGQLVLNAGESAGHATGQAGEIVYVNAEQGLEINSSPDNWSSSWAGRNTAYICDVSGNSSLPGDLTITGSLLATTKSFDIEHPTKEGQRLQHGSLEGPENGVYVRGKGSVGSPVELPDYWTGLVDGDSITVQVTPIGTAATLYVADISENTVTIGGSEEGVEFFYFIQAERKDVEKLVVEYDN